MSPNGSALHGATRGTVSRRRVYYLSGFDPRGAGHYHRLYREEAARQAELLGVRIDVGARRREAGQVCRWDVVADWAGQHVETEYLFMGWDDIVRRDWQPRRLSVVASGLRTLAHYATQGALGTICRAGRGPCFSALFPYLGLALLIFTSLLVGGFSGALLAFATGSWLAGGVAGVAVGAGLVAGSLSLAERVGMFWLLRTYRFANCWGRRPVDELEARLDRIAERILQDCSDQRADEVLVIGHSVGSMLAVSVAARLLRAAPEGLPNLKVLTLGGCIPLLSLLPSAEGVRRDLSALGASRVMPWIDVAAVADPLCFARTNPLLLSGLPLTSPGQPRQVIARFFRMFSPERYERLRRNKLRLHFQYLMAGEIAADYDYFHLTAGPDPVADH